jgi:hypothetical protein
MQTEYGKPQGYDRARGKVVGKKNIQLSTMEEAFTSEHWIVRIYKVKHRSGDVLNSDNKTFEWFICYYLSIGLI